MYEQSLSAVGAVCYPEQAKIVAGDTGKFALKNARIAYNFVIGGEIQNCKTPSEVFSYSSNFLCFGNI